MAVFISLLYLLYRVAGLIIISPCSPDHRGVFSFPDSFSPLFFNLENVHASSGSSSFSDRNNFLYLAHLSLSVSLFLDFRIFRFVPISRIAEDQKYAVIHSRNPPTSKPTKILFLRFLPVLRRNLSLRIRLSTRVDPILCLFHRFYIQSPRFIHFHLAQLTVHQQLYPSDTLAQRFHPFCSRTINNIYVYICIRNFKKQSKWALATVERGDHSPAAAELGRNLTFAEETFLYSINSDAPTADSPSFICFNVM